MVLTNSHPLDCSRISFNSTNRKGWRLICFLQDMWNQPYTYFWTAAHAASHGSLTPSEEIAICCLPHICAHRHPQLSSTAVIDREESMPSLSVREHEQICFLDFQIQTCDVEHLQKEKSCIRYSHMYIINSLASSKSQRCIWSQFLSVTLNQYFWFYDVMLPQNKQIEMAPIWYPASLSGWYQQKMVDRYQRN